MRERRASAVALVFAAACSVQGGAAVAKSLFPQLGPPGVVFLRLLFGSVALWAIARPELRGRSRADLRLVAALGVVLVSMNITFYEAIDRFGLFGSERIALHWPRVVGLALLAAGAALSLRK